jgi:hypothetical protein
VVLRLPISPEGIAELARLGWITLRDGRDPQAVADATIDLADAALGARLRPSMRASEQHPPQCAPISRR